MNNKELNEYCNMLAEEIMLEVKNYDGDQFDLAHQYADGSEYVIYYAKAHDLCQNCSTDNGEEWLSEVGAGESPTYDSIATVIAYGEIYTRILNRINEIEIEELEALEA